MRKKIKGYEPCNGCGVCTLPCPIWQQSYNTLNTFAGRARALQGGADIEELRESVGACILCGSCEPACSRGINTVDITLKLRAALNGDISQDNRRLSPASSSSPGKGLIPGRALRDRPALLQQVASLLSLSTTGDDGDDILETFAAGTVPGRSREDEFLHMVAGLNVVVTPSGILKRYIRSHIPGIEVKGLGEELISLAVIQASLRRTDLYLIDASSYNSDFVRCMPLYTGVSRKTGCAMNLDLQRIAIPTGSAYHPGTDAAPKAVEQIRWILEGKRFNRIVVEAVEDLSLLEGITGMPVIHAAELVVQGVK